MRNHLKRGLSLLLALSVALTLLCSGAWAAGKSGKCGAKLTWKISGSTLTISGSGAMTNYTDNAPWLPYLGSVKTISIQKGVTTVGNNAFNLDYESDNEDDEEEPVVITSISVTLPATLKTIGNGAFSGLPLTKVTIPASVTKLGEEAFSWTQLSTVTFQKGSKLTTLGDGVFIFSPKLKSITLPSGVKKLGASLFENNIKVYFTGNAPTFNSDTFDSNTGITAYYPAGNKTWTKAKLKNYGSDKKVAWKLWNPATPSISSLTGGSKALTVKWGKVKASGYVVQYATNTSYSGAKSVTVKGGSKTSQTIKKLAAKKKYAVRVRSYLTVSGKTYYSTWSEGKIAATK